MDVPFTLVTCNTGDFVDVKELGTLSLCDFGGGQAQKDEVQIYREAQFLFLMQRLKKSNLPQGIETLTDFAEHLAASVDIVFPVIHGSFGEDGVIQFLLIIDSSGASRKI
ncbi:hypothetical protein L2E82_30460 [Cichorium intybus]|uniref:Uncharacterized protein n=1 Tax=Cichorium intybus TaxID=13427 RepID=A0ACB9D0W2_CICIN|nr:hypothetical protein L2E82_30460 [Cichorium intybus]